METASYRFKIKVQCGHLIAGCTGFGLYRSVTSAENFSRLCCSLILGLATGPILLRPVCSASQLTLLMSSSLIPES